MTIYTVSSAAQLNSALASAKDGDRIQMSGGNYGDVSISGKNFANGITIEALDKTNPPVFNTVKVVSSTNLIFDGIDVDFKPTAATNDWDSAFFVNYSAGIQILNSSFTGGNAVAGMDPNNTHLSAGANGVAGFPIGRGLTFWNSQDVTFNGNTIDGFTHGVHFDSVDQIVFNNNEIANFRKVPVNGPDVSNLHMEGNYFHDARPWNFSATGDHGDFVHFWTEPGQPAPSQNFVFKNNFFAQGDGTPVLGIYLDDNTNNVGFRNVLVENNTIHNGNGQALRMEDVVGLIVRDNTFVGTPQYANVLPHIVLDTGNRNVLIENNIFSGVSGLGTHNLAGDNIVIVNNLTVQITDPSKANYAGYIFVKGVTQNAGYGDLRVVAGSLGDGMGATTTAIPLTPAVPASPYTSGGGTSSGGGIPVPTAFGGPTAQPLGADEDAEVVVAPDDDAEASDEDEVVA
ncbi:MAG: right-handed parallel beta-helix repeat-containing protein, partial [Albidovulum sp.]